MDEATITTEERIQQQQLAELRAKVEGLQTSPAKESTLTDSIVPIDLEKTPEFEAWKKAKLQEHLNYLANNWGIAITIERLLMRHESLGYPDPRNRRSHAPAWGNNYIDPATGTVAINPATGLRMTYTIWREIDPPAPEPAPEPTI